MRKAADWISWFGRELRSRQTNLSSHDGATDGVVLIFVDHATYFPRVGQGVSMHGVSLATCPFPDLSHRCGEVLCCDNITVVGVDALDVETAKAHIVSACMQCRMSVALRQCWVPTWAVPTSRVHLDRFASGALSVDVPWKCFWPILLCDRDCLPPQAVVLQIAVYVRARWVHDS